jgi:hypothetical protein
MSSPFAMALLMGAAGVVGLCMNIVLVILAINGKQRHPRASAFAISSAAIAFMVFGLQWLVPVMAQRFSESSTAMALGYAVVGAVGLVGHGLLMGAVFADRGVAP